jgi:hypothetical protein
VIGVRHRIVGISTLFTAALLLGPAVAAAETIVVSPDGPLTIQDAVDLAVDSDVVALDDGVYTGDGNRDVDFLGKAIGIRSALGDPTTCIVDCQASAADRHRGFVFLSGESNEAYLEGITIANGYAENLDDPWPEGLGGGVLVMGGSAPTLRALILQNNTAMAGAGMFVGENASPTIADCLFVGNSAWWGSGGGISSVGSTLHLADCRFRDNTAYQAGGGVAQSGTESLFERCEFYDNAVEHGDDIGYGGGLDCFAGTDCELIDCTFAGNTAPSGGAVAVWFSSSSCRIQNCTLVENSALQGGGIYVDGSSADILFSIIAFSGEGSAVSCVGTAPITASCSDFFDNAGGDWVDCVAGMETIPGNTSEDPLFCGDANPTAPYTLTDGSPCGPDHYPCSLMGAWPIGCGATSVDPSLPPHSLVTLRQALPNPFNPQTTIRFDLREQAAITLGIYDISGHLLKTLVNGEVYVAGDHEVVWRGEDDAGRSLPSGSYVVRLRSAAGQQTRKVMLVR